MIPLIAHYVRAFLFDEGAAKRLLLGLGGLLGGALVTVLAFGTDTVLAWPPRELAKHCIVAAVSALAAMLPAPAVLPRSEPGK